MPWSSIPNIVLVLWRCIHYNVVNRRWCSKSKLQKFTYLLHKKLWLCHSFTLAKNMWTFKTKASSIDSQKRARNWLIFVIFELCNSGNHFVGIPLSFLLIKCYKFMSSKPILYFPRKIKNLPLLSDPLVPSNDHVESDTDRQICSFFLYPTDHICLRLMAHFSHLLKLPIVSNLRNFVSYESTKTIMKVIVTENLWIACKRIWFI